MEKTKFDDHFVKFPYKKEINGNKINNGEIDLVKELFTFVAQRMLIVSGFFFI